jgi:glyoxylase-like metal-dependent hydrolase (beta-lactamase superfamily II)
MLGLGAAALAMPRGVLAQQTPQPSAQLTPLAEDVYLYRSIGHQSVFIVTDDGVIATDPIGQSNPRSPQLYQATITAVTDKPVKYVVYSHDHADHIQGGAVFADTAEFVSQELAAPKIAARDNPVTPVPTITFAERMSLELGGKTVELQYVGRNHSDNSLILHYPARRLVFAVDFIPVRGLPFRNLGDSYPEEWVESLRRVEAIDFDVLVPGHGEVGTKDSVRQMREYFTDLMGSIRAARQRGLADNSGEMVEAVRADLAPKYGTGQNFGPYLPENIQGILTSMSG